jgi:hypothetical protein
MREVERSCIENVFLGIRYQNFNQKIEVLSDKIEKKDSIMPVC